MNLEWIKIPCLQCSDKAKMFFLSSSLKHGFMYFMASRIQIISNIIDVCDKA